MVEEIVGIEAELGLDAVGDGEVLRQRHIVVEGMRTSVGINSCIANLAASGKSERPGARPSRRAGVQCASKDSIRCVGNLRSGLLTPRWYRGEPAGSTVIMSKTGVMRYGSYL